jgi:DNA repair protein RadC
MLVHPQEVFKSAILLNANSFILVHNHPSGDQEPMKEDIKLTEEWYIRHLFGGMKQISRMMKIPLKDHVIIGKGWFSFFERRMNGEG